MIDDSPKDKKIKNLGVIKTFIFKSRIMFLRSAFHMIAALHSKPDLPISVFGLETCSCSISRSLVLLGDIFPCINSFRMLGPGHLVY